MDDLKALQRDIDSLLEGNRLDWHDLATKHMFPPERRAIRWSIKIRTEGLNELLRRKWRLQGKKTGEWT